MWPLIKHSGRFYALYSLSIIVLMIFFAITAETKDLGYALFMSVYMWVAISGSISISEGYEEKNNGYDFLQILPVKHREIVVSKFILCFIAVSFFTAFNIFLFRRVIENPELAAVSVTLTLLNGVISLITAGLLYILVFKYGMPRNMVAIFWGIVFVAVLIAFALNLSLAKMNLVGLAEMARSWAWYLIPLLGLLGYYHLMRAAIKVKECERKRS
ncbi:MAG: ABC-2 transporter permease [bacterium]|nr:ABC-2 transporter permease [bacterium]